MDDHDRLLRALLIERYAPWPPGAAEGGDRLRKQLLRERRRTSQPRHGRGGERRGLTPRPEDRT